MELYKEIRELSDKFESQLKKQMDSRVLEMDGDDDSHYLIYRVLGISEAEGKSIDVYQNKGRFLYKYAGSFLEGVAKLCFTHRYPDSSTVQIPNSLGERPKTFEIDCLVENRDAIEVKWRDATTDGDHITKEHTRLRVIASAGFKHIRVMFYYPNRAQAIRIQKTLETLYKGVSGEYYFGDAVWQFISEYTGIKLKEILIKIAEEKTANAAG
jgi:hypothetical protein